MTYNALDGIEEASQVARHIMAPRNLGLKSTIRMEQSLAIAIVQWF